MRVKRWIITSAVTVAAATLIAPGTASAGPRDCRLDPSSGQVHYEVFPRLAEDPRIPLPGNAPGGVGFGQRGHVNKELRPGDVVRISATGTVHYGGFLGWAGEWGPNGDVTAETPRHFPAPNLWKFSVYGQWNHTGGQFPIGGRSACVTVPPGGNGDSIPWLLFIRTNDDEHGDNTKAYGLTIEWWHVGWR